MLAPFHGPLLPEDCLLDLCPKKLLIAVVLTSGLDSFNLKSRFSLFLISVNLNFSMVGGYDQREGSRTIVKR